MTERKIEDIVKVSSKGQIVLPRDVRKQLGIIPGKKLSVEVKGKEVILKKLENLTLVEISDRLGSEMEKEKIDVDNLVNEAVKWARKRK